MSYILDALRRAEAERERGAVPGLQSQQHAIADDDAVAAPRSRGLLWAVVALTIALVAVIAWNVFGGAGAPPRPIAEGSVAPAPAPVPPAPLATAPPVAAHEVAAPAPPVATPAALAPQAAGTASAAVATATPSVARKHVEPKRTAHHVAPSSKGVARAETADTLAGEPRIYTQAELPEDVRRDLPKIVIGGSSYSGDAASRMLMINGQIFHEGDQLGHGLVLERIQLKSAILAYKGYRYEVKF